MPPLYLCLNIRISTKIYYTLLIKNFKIVNKRSSTPCPGTQSGAQCRCPGTQSHFAGISVCKTICVHARSCSKQFRDRALGYHGGSLDDLGDSGPTVTDPTGVFSTVCLYMPAPECSFLQNVETLTPDVSTILH